HYPFRGRQDGYTKPVQDAWYVVYSCIFSQTRLAHTFQGADRWNLADRMILQCNFDRALHRIVVKFIICNITLIEEHLGDLLFQVRCRNFNNPVVGLDGIPYSGKVIRYWICIHLYDSIMITVSAGHRGHRTYYRLKCN